MILLSLACETADSSSGDSLTDQTLERSSDSAISDALPSMPSESLDIGMNATASDLSPSELDAAPNELEPPEFLGGDRPAAYVLPDEYDPQVPAPLVLLLHGYTGTATFQERYFQLKAQTQQKGIILVLPNGRVNPEGSQFWSATDFCCDFYQQGDIDVDYLRGLIEEAQSHFSVDTRHIALIGHSNGGFMSYRFACEMPELITHVVSLAGASWSDPAACAQPRPVSVLQIHGTLDLVIRYEGQRESMGDPSANWNLEQCWGASCQEPQARCAQAPACADLWACMTRCGWDDAQQSCRDQCYADTPAMEQTLWLEEFACVLNAGCFDDPTQSSLINLATRFLPTLIPFVLSSLWIRGAP